MTMATQLVTGNPLKAMDSAALLAGLSKSVEASVGEVYNYLSFDGREGRFKLSKGAGNEPDPFQPEGDYLLNLLDTKHEYVCWKDGKLIDSLSLTIFEPLPPMESLTDHGPYNSDKEKREGWKKQYSLLLRDDKANKQYRLNISAISATKAFDAFLLTLLEQLPLHDIKAETPRVKLSVESFKWQGNRNYKPKFELTTWAVNPTDDKAAVAAIAAPAEAEEGAKATPSTRKR